MFAHFYPYEKILADLLRHVLIFLEDVIIELMRNGFVGEIQGKAAKGSWIGAGIAMAAACVGNLYGQWVGAKFLTIGLCSGRADQKFAGDDRLQYKTNRKGLFDVPVVIAHAALVIGTAYHGEILKSRGIDAFHIAGILDGEFNLEVIILANDTVISRSRELYLAIRSRDQPAEEGEAKCRTVKYSK